MIFAAVRVEEKGLHVGLKREDLIAGAKLRVMLAELMIMLELTLRDQHGEEGCVFVSEGRRVVWWRQEKQP